MTLTEDLTGRPLGKYELRERIGRGGMAEVYKAYHASLDRFVALKILHSFLSEDPEFKDRFEREARNIAKLRHNNIVHVYDFDFEPGPDLYYMVMEFIDGPTLRELLMQQETGRLPIPEVIRIARALAEALSYAHEAEMIHRDIKPGNVMLDADKRVVLTDFGIAKIVSGQSLTASGTMLGTPAYMAPEQGLGQAGDHRSDIYSLGVVMYQMAAGRPPYQADTPIALVLKHVNDPLPPLSNFNPDLPEGLERIIYKSLAKDPDERFQSASDLAEALEDLETAARIEIPASTPKPVPTIVRPEARKVIVKEEDSTIAKHAALRAFIQAHREQITGATVGAAMAAVVAAAVFLLGGQRGGNTSETALEITTPAQTASPTTAPEAAGVTEATGTAFITETATPDLEATALVTTLDIIRAQRATQIALATRPAEGTGLPPLVETGCDYRYEKISQMPLHEAAILENSTITKRIVLKNSSDCTWEAGAAFRFLDGLQLGAPDEIAIDRAVKPGERITLEFDLTLPSYSPKDRMVQSTWQLTTADGQRIGRLFTFNIEIVPPTATPTPTSTPTSTPTTTPTPTATPTPTLTPSPTPTVGI